MDLDVKQELAQRGAVITDEHFVYTSGKHGSGYVNMDPLFVDIKLMRELSEMLDDIDKLEGYYDDEEVIAAPATGGIVLAVLCANDYCDVAVWADKKDDGFVFERAGFKEALNGKRVLVVEDLLNTGGSVKKVIEQVRLCGGIVIGVSVICNRGSETAESLGVPFLKALTSVDFTAVEADGCELCEAGVPIVTDVGHGDKFQQQHPDYKGGYKTLLS